MLKNNSQKVGTKEANPKAWGTDMEPSIITKEVNIVEIGWTVKCMVRERSIMLMVE